MAKRSSAGGSRLGAALRALRRQNGWTLADVSRRTGFSVPTLSKVENHRASLSYDKLIRLSQGLGVDISRLFTKAGTAVEPPAITGRRSINRARDGQLVETRNYDYYYLSTDVRQKKLIPIRSSVRCRTLHEFGTLLKHSGEEFIYVLEGTVEVHTELYEPYILRSGESTYIDSTMGHGYLAKGDGPCTILAVCSAEGQQFPEAGSVTEGASGPEKLRGRRRPRRTPGRHR